MQQRSAGIAATFVEPRYSNDTESRPQVSKEAISTKAEDEDEHTDELTQLTLVEHSKPKPSLNNSTKTIEEVGQIEPEYLAPDDEEEDLNARLQEELAALDSLGVRSSRLLLMRLLIYAVPCSSSNTTSLTYG